MSIFRKSLLATVVLAFVTTTVLSVRAQQDVSLVRFIEVAEIPVSLISMDSARTVTRPSGSVLVIDLRVTVQLRNDSPRPIRGVCFGVWTGKSALGGKASVAVPGLYVQPGEMVPLRFAVRLLRPLLPTHSEDAILVEIDGLLFDDLHFVGPGKFGSERRLKVWAMQADRDREAMREALVLGGPEQLREQVITGLATQKQRPRLEARPLARTLSISARNFSERRLMLAFLDMPRSPISAIKGSAFVAGRTAHSPEITVANRSSKAVQYFELGWVVNDNQGRRYAAGSLSSPGSPILLAPGETVATSADRRFSFHPIGDDNNPDFFVEGIRGFITQVQFEDGSIWIPSREDLQRVDLLSLLPASPEEQRLTNIYRHHGIEALIHELNRY